MSPLTPLDPEDPLVPLIAGVPGAPFAPVAPTGIVKSNSAAVDVPVLLTLTGVFSKPVDTVPTAIVPVIPEDPLEPELPLEPSVPEVPTYTTLPTISAPLTECVNIKLFPDKAAPL